MCKDTVRALVNNDIISICNESSEKYYWVYEQCNSEIDLMIQDDDGGLLDVVRIICDNDQYEIQTDSMDEDYSFVDFDADKLVLKSGANLVSWQLYVDNHIDLVNYSKVL